MPSRRRRYRARPKQQVKRPPANEEIKAAEVRLIGAEGEQLGVVPTPKAREMAAEIESDLVIVAQKADPPVVRIMDLGKHVYEQRKKMAKQKVKSKGGDVKGVRISFKIGQHYPVGLYSDHLVRFASDQSVNRCRTQPQSQQPIHSGGRAASLHMTQRY